jgi:hypothetical protein
MACPRDILALRAVPIRLGRHFLTDSTRMCEAHGEKKTEKTGQPELSDFSESLGSPVAL